MPFVKGVIISQCSDDVELYQYNSDEIKQWGNDRPEYFMNCLRVALNQLFFDFKQQYNKLEECKNYSVSAAYEEYFIRKQQIGKNLLMIVIADIKGLDMGSLDYCFDEYTANFVAVDETIGKLQL